MWPKMARGGRSGGGTRLRADPDGCGRHASTGFEATQAIRAGQRNRDVPIIATAQPMPSPSDRADCLAAGMQEHIAKRRQPLARYRALLTWLRQRLSMPDFGQFSGFTAADTLPLPGRPLVCGWRNVYLVVVTGSRLADNCRRVALFQP